MKQVILVVLAVIGALALLWWLGMGAMMLWMMNP